MDLNGSINKMFKLGFSISYSEVDKFKISIVAKQSLGYSVINVYSKVFMQFELQMDQGYFMEWGLQQYQPPFPENSVLKEKDKIT